MKNVYSKNNRCINCGKLITNIAIRCLSCCQKGNRRGLKHGRNCKSNYCIDCGKKISPNARRCYSCANKGKNHPQFKGDKALFRQVYHCKEEDCNNEIVYDTWKRGQGRCRLCTNKIHSESIRGENHPNWQGGCGKNGYPFEFNEELKTKICKRDNYICQCCGMTEEEHLIIIGRKLSIHHIDYNKKNCEESNLITTCHWCNLKANYNRNYWNIFYKKKMEETNAKKTS